MAAPEDLDPATALPRTLGLLRSKDDTSRFVGLALLKTLLDNHEVLRSDESVISECWDAISPTFLDRLLRASESEGKKSKAEAKDMVSIAVAVIHTFSSLLPEKKRESDGMVKRGKGLVGALTRSSSDTTTQILQTLVTIASSPAGALELCKIHDITPLIELAPQQSLALDVIERMGRYGLEESSLSSSPERFEKTITALVLVFRDSHDQQPLFKAINAMLYWTEPESTPETPAWITPLVKRLLTSLVSRPTPQMRQTATILASSLLQAYPDIVPPLLFSSPPSPTTSSSPEVPPCYLLISAILIDLRSTLPSVPPLMAASHRNESYADTVVRLHASFTVFFSFTGFLLASLSLPTSPLPPSLLLKLRPSIAATLSTTISYLRAAYDASPDETKSTTLPAAAVGALSIYLREDDDGGKLKQEALGITDVLLFLVCAIVESKLPVVMALEAIVDSKEGVAKFLEEDGFKMLAEQLEMSLQRLGVEAEDDSDDDADADADEDDDEDAYEDVEDQQDAWEDQKVGMEIARVLLAVLEHPSVSTSTANGPPALTIKHEFLTRLLEKCTAFILHLINHQHDDDDVDLATLSMAVGQLILALLDTLSPSELQSRSSSIASLHEWAKKRKVTALHDARRDLETWGQVLESAIEIEEGLGKVDAKSGAGASIEEGLGKVSLNAKVSASGGE